MKLKLDENFPGDVAGALRDGGFDVQTAAQEGMSGASDRAVLSEAQQEERVFVTLDLDFSDIRAYPPRDYYGIVVLRPHSQAEGAVARVMSEVIDVLSRERVAQRLWIAEPNRIRIHD